MSQEESSSSQEPEEEHLGVKWEAAVITILVVILFGIIATTIFHYRRKQRRRRAERLDTEAEAANLGPNTSDSGVRVSAPHSRSQSQSQPDVGLTKMEYDSGSDVNLTKPPPAASSKRSSKASFVDHPSQMPPRYYWDHR